MGEFPRAEKKGTESSLSNGGLIISRERAERETLSSLVLKVPQVWRSLGEEMQRLGESMGTGE